MDKYLGLQPWLEKIKKQTFSANKQKVQHNLQEWNGKLLSKSGKEVLIKAVALSIQPIPWIVFDCLKVCVKKLNNLWPTFGWDKKKRWEEKLLGELEELMQD